jgi:hypothetical protein
MFSSVIIRRFQPLINIKVCLLTICLLMRLFFTTDTPILAAVYFIETATQTGRGKTRRLPLVRHD